MADIDGTDVLDGLFGELFADEDEKEVAGPVTPARAPAAPRGEARRPVVIRATLSPTDYEYMKTMADEAGVDTDKLVTAVIADWLVYSRYAKSDDKSSERKGEVGCSILTKERLEKLLAAYKPGDVFTAPEVRNVLTGLHPSSIGSIARYFEKDGYAMRTGVVLKHNTVLYKRTDKMPFISEPGSPRCPKCGGTNLDLNEWVQDHKWRFLCKDCGRRYLAEIVEHAPPTVAKSVPVKPNKYMTKNDTVAKYLRNHPRANPREISKATGVLIKTVMSCRSWKERRNHG